MRPMFKHYGGKWRLSGKCPPPLPGLPIVEPFAGGAGYSTRYGEGRIVHLYDTCPITCSIWEYLLGASQADILALPVDEVMREGADIRELGLPDGAMRLVQRWLTTQGRLDAWWPTPMVLRYHLASDRRSGWGPIIRQRIADQLPGIARWTITNADYRTAPDIEATWHVDPPYQRNVQAQAGKYGRFTLDYAELGAWCRTRRERVMVHEQEGADWLPFEPWIVAANGNAGAGKRKHVLEVRWPPCQPRERDATDERWGSDGGGVTGERRGAGRGGCAMGEQDGKQVRGDEDKTKTRMKTRMKLG